MHGADLGQSVPCSSDLKPRVHGLAEPNWTTADPQISSEKNVVFWPPRSRLICYRLFLWQHLTIMTNSVLKSRDITWLTKVHIVKAVVFIHKVMYGCESWTIKKAEHQRIDTFQLWCWRRLF